MENIDLASQFAGAIVALACHASGAGGGAIITGKPKLQHDQTTTRPNDNTMTFSLKMANSLEY